MSTTFNYISFFNENDDALRQYWGKEAAGCIFVAKNSGRILLAHRSEQVEEPDTWGGWGGKVDFEETPKQAVEREIEEETGLKGSYKLIPLYVYRDGSFKYHNFMVLVPFEFTPQLNWESNNSTWVEYGDWPDPLHFGLKELIKHDGNKIKKVIDLINKKRDNIHEDVNTPPPPSPTAIIRQVDQPAKTNVVAGKNLISAYIVIATLWSEAREEGEIGMHAVMNIIMNRSGGDFSKARDTVLSKSQFSVWNGVKDPEKSALNLAKIQRANNNKLPDSKMYQEAIRIVDKAMKGQLPDITGGATFYVNPSKSNPKWIRQMTKTKSIGNHTFYKPKIRLKKEQQIKEDLNNFPISNQGLVDDGVYGYEMKSSFGHLRYGYKPTNRTFYLYVIAIPDVNNQHKGYATELLEYFFQLIKKSNGTLNVGPYTGSGMSYIKHVVERLAKQYNVRLI